MERAKNWLLWSMVFNSTNVNLSYDIKELVGKKLLKLLKSDTVDLFDVLWGCMQKEALPVGRENTGGGGKEQKMD